MNTTTNYELNLPEGSDLFAPMTDYNPNFTKIDSAMAENRNAAVHSATEAIAGTVHNITRDEPDATMFRWTATGNFTSGDTFTVDGVSVTAIGANGQGLVTGAWLTGTEVLASLVGSVMTVYTSATSSDAETLDGHPASYFGTATAVAQAQSDATAAGTLANAAQNRADQAYALAEAAGGSLKSTLLWTNTAELTVAGYPATNVDINVPSNTKFLMFIVCTASYTTNEPAAQIFLYTPQTNFFGLQGSNLGRWNCRRIVRKNGATFSFENATQYENDQLQTNNSMLIPYKIYALS